MIEDITPSEFVRRRDSGELWALLDVREAWEIDIARIEQTTDIPMAEIPARLAELDASQAVAVLCHAGGRRRSQTTWRRPDLIASPILWAVSTRGLRTSMIRYPAIDFPPGHHLADIVI